jgi:RsiW-degrading membrane proteinase PrsW (M82 family)
MFDGFTQDQLKELILVVVLASLPAMIWSYVIFKGRATSRWVLLLAFFLGTLTVLPLIFLYDFLFVKFPELDIYTLIEKNVSDVHFAALSSLMVVGMLEELAKSGVVRVLDKTKIGIQTINDSVKYSILAGLGFAFTENIFYFYQIWLQSSGLGDFLFPVIFRSIFTVCAHMVFSGIFGYFYGIAKFARPILETNLWMGESTSGVKWWAKLTGRDEPQAFKELTLWKGLLLAMALHAGFDFALQFSQFFPVLILIGGGFLYLLYLLAHKAGDIVFAASGGRTTMARQDVDVVLELLGMWSKEGRYKDVVDICQRLLMRDPDNKVVQLFQAKAMEEQKLANLEESFTSLFRSQNSEMEDKSLRTLVKQKVLMEMLKEKQAPLPAQALQSVPKPPAPEGPKLPTIPRAAGPRKDPSSPQ